MNKIWVFHGCDHKVGTTMMAHETAKMISNIEIGIKVLFIVMNGHDYAKYCRENRFSIENIKLKVENNLLTSEDVLSACGRDGELYVIGGVKGAFNHRNYAASFPDVLLKCAEGIFDVIIVDSGNEVDSGLCVGALKATENRILVVNQNASSLIRLNEFRSIYDTLEIKFPYILINKYNSDDPHDASYIKNWMEGEKMNNVYCVRDESESARLAEMDEMLISDYKCPGYTKDIRELSCDILKLSGIREELIEPKKKKIFGFM